MEQHYERMRARLLEAVAEHERGELDDEGLQSSIEGAREALDNAHSDVRQVLFEADVALEYIRFGHPDELENYDKDAAVKRVRRNLREVLR